MEIEELKAEIRNIKEPRWTRYGHICHKLIDIIIGLCTVICGGEDFADMEEFGKTRREYLAQFLELPNGIPDSDTFRRVFERINPSELSAALNNWISAEQKKRAVVAIDGKTICGSGNEKHKAYHVISAFVAENQLTLGGLSVEEKTNEITAVPELLDIVDVEGAIVTADAMSCQKKTVEKIIEKKADYTIGLKQNQPALYQDAEDYGNTAQRPPFWLCTRFACIFSVISHSFCLPIVRLAALNLCTLTKNLTAQLMHNLCAVLPYFCEFPADLPVLKTKEKGHGRIEKREYRLLTEIGWLEQKEDWRGLHGLGMVKSTVTENEEMREYTRYFITSLTDIHEFVDSVRKHWPIENQLHWCLDVIFREDASRARKDNFSPLNMNVLPKTALFFVSQASIWQVKQEKIDVQSRS